MKRHKREHLRDKETEKITRTDKEKNQRNHESKSIKKH